jgi:hypothetical protein
MGRFRRHLSYANVVATMALVFAMSGGALAASHYLITKTSQIKPSVLKKLKGNVGHTGVTGATGATGAQGPTGKEGQPGSPGASGTTVVYRVRSVAPLQTATGSEAKAETAVLNDPLNGTWTQAADEVDQIVGQVTFTAPAQTSCSENTSTSPVEVKILVDGTDAASFYDYGEAGKPTTAPIEFYNGSSEPSWTLFEPGTPTTNSITAKVGDRCGWAGGKTGAHFTINAIELDVLGAH